MEEAGAPYSAEVSLYSLDTPALASFSWGSPVRPGGPADLAIKKAIADPLGFNSAITHLEQNWANFKRDRAPVWGMHALFGGLVLIGLIGLVTGAGAGAAPTGKVVRVVGRRRKERAKAKAAAAAAAPKEEGPAPADD